MQIRYICTKICNIQNMKKILLIATVSILLFSCKKVGDGEFLITGTIKGMKTGLIFLQKEAPNGMGIVNIDTVKIVDDKFEFKGKADEPAITVLEIQNVHGKIPFILEQGEITIEVNKDSLYASKTSGTYDNEELYKFNKETLKLRTKYNKSVIDFQNKNMAKMKEAQTNKDTATISALARQNNELQKVVSDRVKEYTFAYPKSHPKSFISVLIVQAMFANPTADVKEIETIFNSLDASLKKTKPGKIIKENIDKLKKQNNVKSTVGIGLIAPDFKAPTPDGKMVSLKESLGKVTLVDFWASWCNPCRQENPNVVALYKEFHAKGLNILSVSLDSDVAKWKEAIAKDQLTWTQISNLKEMKDPIALQYGVNQIPTTFLLDSSGKIVAVDLRGDALKAKVNELLNAK